MTASSCMPTSRRCATSRPRSNQNCRVVAVSGGYQPVRRQDRPGRDLVRSAVRSWSRAKRRATASRPLRAGRLRLRRASPPIGLCRTAGTPASAPTGQAYRIGFDRALEARQGCQRQRQRQAMRFEGDEAVEQGLDHVGPLLLVCAAARAEIVPRDSLRRRLPRSDGGPAVRPATAVADRPPRASTSR